MNAVGALLCAAMLTPSLRVSAQLPDSSAPKLPYTLRDLTTDLAKLTEVRATEDRFDGSLSLSWRNYAGSRVGTSIYFGLYIDRDRNLFPWIEVRTISSDCIMVRDVSFKTDSLSIRLPSAQPETEESAGMTIEWTTLHIDEYYFRKIAESRSLRIRISGRRGTIEVPEEECLILQSAMHAWVHAVMPLARRYSAGS